MLKREPEEFNKFDVIYVRAEVPLYFVSGSRDIDDWEKPGDSGGWWLEVGTDTWHSITDIRELYGEPRPGMVRPRPDWEEESE